MDHLQNEEKRIKNEFNERDSQVLKNQITADQKIKERQAAEKEGRGHEPPEVAVRYAQEMSESIEEHKRQRDELFQKHIAELEKNHQLQDAVKSQHNADLNQLDSRYKADKELAHGGGAIGETDTDKKKREIEERMAKFREEQERKRQEKSGWSR
jgi:hypothetical protein